MNLSILNISLLLSTILVVNTDAFATSRKPFVSSSKLSAAIAISPTQLGYAVPESIVPVTPANLKPTTKAASPSKKKTSPLREVVGFEDLANMIENAPPDQDTVVYFYANYCKKCKVAMPRYTKIAKEEQKKGTDTKVKFAKMESSKLITKKIKEIRH
mmetsp:Transcript_24861/g.38321  ORF Transcript_24861/g.38321 Transcript_24861/m.38321 type:complete len:158 (+) Transcript_24861:77-550(+)